jgi:hypothetical protein
VVEKELIRINEPENKEAVAMIMEHQRQHAHIK